MKKLEYTFYNCLEVQDGSFIYININLNINDKEILPN